MQLDGNFCALCHVLVFFIFFILDMLITSFNLNEKKNLNMTVYHPIWIFILFTPINLPPVQLMPHAIRTLLLHSLIPTTI